MACNFCYALILSFMWRWLPGRPEFKRCGSPRHFNNICLCAGWLRKSSICFTCIYLSFLHAFKAQKNVFQSGEKLKYLTSTGYWGSAPGTAWHAPHVAQESQFLSVSTANAKPFLKVNLGSAVGTNKSLKGKFSENDLSNTMPTPALSLAGVL